MKSYTIPTLLVLFLWINSCNKKQKNSEKTDFTIAFGSCNKQNKTNLLWSEIKKNNPDLWIWGGDNIYADTEDMNKMEKEYQQLKNQKGYQDLIQDIPVLAIWDDHDFGENDGGVEYPKKKEAQSLFLDFLNVDADSKRRQQDGIYHSQIIKNEKGSIKIILLDTRYFRTKLTRNQEVKTKRYVPNIYGEGTVLGNKQWQWLQTELHNSTADFNIIVTSIQFLSSEHGFETWGNFPHEVDKLKNIIGKSSAKGVFFISGDRHISEFSKLEFDQLSYPLIDFTSSGLTHAYTSYSGEPNKFRVQDVVSKISFGLLQFDFENKKVTMQMRGKNNTLIQELTQVYP